MRVLVNIPSLALQGGVANHYKGLAPFWKKNVSYNTVGRRFGVPSSLCLIYDYVKFVFVLVLTCPSVVVLNPSLGRTAILRDSLFLALAKILGLRVVVFFHGWDSRQKEFIDSSSESFRRKFQRADAFIVLANEFALDLQSWGLKAPIYLSTTKVDDRLLVNFDIERKEYAKTVLFLARLEPDKGIFLALEAFSQVVANNPDARFVVAGSGSALDAAVEFVESRSISNVEFLGNVSGTSLIKAFSEADIYILPTVHGEGMPTSVLEAMAFGMPVVTRPVGGLKDFFEDQKMGLMSDSLGPNWYADAMNKFLLDHKLMKQVGLYNHRYAKKNFLASKVALQLEEIFEKV